MTRTLFAFGFAAVLLCLVAGAAKADIIDISVPQSPSSGPTRLVTAAESSSAVQPAPVGGSVYQLRVTTDGDILSVNNILITQFSPGATLYQNLFGDPGNANKPSPGLEAAFPSITADSWIDTPGIGTRLGPDLPGDGTTTVGDTTNDGPVSNFVFAQLTLPRGAYAIFYGRISIAAGGGTRVASREFVLYTFDADLDVGPIIPEPTRFTLAGAALLGLVALRRRT